MVTDRLKRVIREGSLRVFLCSLFVLGLTDVAVSIGISPGRNVVSVPQNIPLGYDATLQYNLYHSEDELFTRFYLDGTFADYNMAASIVSVGGIAANDPQDVVIDWEAQGFTSPVAALVKVHCEPDWNSPGGFGTDTVSGATHVQMTEQGGTIGGIAAVFCQTLLYQNFAPTIDIDVAEVAGLGDLVIFDISVGDFLDANPLFTGDAMDYSYSIDWESDGVFDAQAGDLPFYNEDGDQVVRGNLNGPAHGSFSIQHAFSSPGTQTVTVAVSDGMDTTTSYTQVYITPEPGTLGLLALASVFAAGVRKMRTRR